MTDSTALLVSAAGIALVHTLLGPDHTLPFVALARARRWSVGRLWIIVGLCGVGHVLSSFLLGAIGLGMGLAVPVLTGSESVRGEAAALCLVLFGILYGLWGTKRALRHRSHSHIHCHGKILHEHNHVHRGDHIHPHETGAGSPLTPWILFIIFVFGPCEPLIPLFIYPAARHDWTMVWTVSLLFAVVTIGTMLVVTTGLYIGAGLILRLPDERWAHALSGLLVAATGGVVLLFGL